MVRIPTRYRKRSSPPRTRSADATRSAAKRRAPRPTPRRRDNRPSVRAGRTEFAPRAERAREYSFLAFVGWSLKAGVIFANAYSYAIRQPIPERGRRYVDHD